MLRTTSASRSSGAKPNREAEVRSLLEAAGFPRRSKRRVSLAERWSPADAAAHRLAGALSSLGPVFQSFGNYLASRPDLLAAFDQPDLAAIRVDVPAESAARVRSTIARETGAFAEELFQSFADEPEESVLTHQTHRAVLTDGSAVRVKVLRSDAADGIAGEVELLPLLEGALSGLAVSPEALANAVEDFSQCLRHQLDSGVEARWLDALAADAEGLEVLYAPVLHRRICSTTILTTSVPPARVAGKAGIGAGEREEQARLLCVAWLRQCLLGSVFPVDSRQGNVAFTFDGRLVWGGDNFDRLPPEARPGLMDYLLAALGDQADRACRILTKELQDAGADAPGERLMKDFQQAVPFRQGAAEGLAGRIEMQWNLAGAAGSLPRGHMVSFYRGLAAVSALASQLAPDRDVLAQAVQDVHVMVSVSKFRDMLMPKSITGGMAAYARFMVEGPRVLDEGLTTALNGDLVLKVKTSETADQKRSRDSHAVAIALILALPAVAVTVHYAALRLAPNWVGRLDGFAVLVIGLVVLRWMSKGL